MATKPKQDQDKPNPNARPRPATQRADESPTSANEWKQKASVGTLVTVPSGNTVRVRTPGMQVFMAQGVIPNGLMPLLKEAMKQGQGIPEEAAEAMVDDPEKINEILELADAVSLYCFVEPQLHEPPTHLVEVEEDGELKEIRQVVPLGDSARDENLLYVDEVDLNDKLFVFQFAVGGSAKLEQFRTE